MRNIYIQLAEIKPNTPGLVLATVIGTRGSTPQKPGSSALFRNDKLLSGTIGGGIVENRIREYAEISSAKKASACLHFSLENEIEALEEAVCGGTISILVDSEPLSHQDVFRALAQSLREGHGGVLVTKVTAWNESLVNIRRYWTTGDELPLPDKFRSTIMREVSNILSRKASAVFREIEIPIPGEEQPALFFLESVLPLPRLVIAGAGHIGKALSHQGKLLGFEVTVIDDREEYANPANLPDADNIIVRNIGEAMREISKDSTTYIAIVTRGHSHDADALKACIGCDVAYIGMMGSRSKVAAMHQEFISKKWITEEQWEKVCTPIGLEIGSQTVEEIAVSIAAQLVQYRVKG
jgi:xanthine dehydrogenase accessory factor